MRPTSAKPLLIRRSPKVARDCKPGALDLRPDLCHGPSVCKNQFFLCCEYCLTYFTLPTRTTISRYACVYTQIDGIPELCTDISICQTNLRVWCCNYCSKVKNYTATTTTTTTTKLAPPKDCAPGDLDLLPALCTNNSICQTNRSLCCDYCSRVENYTVTWTTEITSPKDCAPGDLDLLPAMCANISICLTNRSFCCDYCSRVENYTVTMTTGITSPKECVLGEPDLKPELCTSPSVCQTEPLMCCNYCTYNSGAIFSLYDTWIYLWFYIHLFLFLSKQMSA
uniref:Uncharacterized protein n=1 Tax=Biomphalaria glabrata TaxID=6526 RepID=A0A2C9M4Q8_BIOGL